MIYVVFNINGCFVDVADSQEEAVDMYTKVCPQNADLQFEQSEDIVRVYAKISDSIMTTVIIGQPYKNLKKKDGNQNL